MSAGTDAAGERDIRRPVLAMSGELIVEKLPEGWVLLLRGEHDLATAPTLDAQLEAVLLHGDRVIVDLAHANFIDSSIVRAILRGLRLAGDTPGGSVVVCAPPDSFARRVLEQAGLAEAIPLVDRRRDAVAGIAESE